MDNVEKSQTARRVVAIAGLCLLSVACNLMVPGTFWNIRSNDWFMQLAYVASGALVAEVCLLGIWCGLSLQPIKYRLPVTAALVLVTACSFSLGLQLPDMGSPRRQGMPLEVALVIAGAGFAMFAVMQVPLWLLRRATRCRISNADSAPVEASLQGSQFQRLDT